MNHAAEVDKMGAKRALQCALASLEKGHYSAALAWAETAEITLRECRLVAPKEEPKLGDYVVVAISVTVITWFFLYGLLSVM